MGKHDKQDIGHRFGERSQAERYRDRFDHGRHLRTHQREVAALQVLLGTLGRLKSVLDVGSGAGRCIPTLAAHADHVIQVDLSSHMLAVSRERHVLPQVAGHVQADITKLAFADDSFDLVFCHRLLNHLPASARVLAMQELTRVSKKYVTVSCLTPPAALRLLRRAYYRIRGRRPVDGVVEPRDLIAEAKSAGLHLAMRTAIRRGFRSAAFLTFQVEKP